MENRRCDVCGTLMEGHALFGCYAQSFYIRWVKRRLLERMEDQLDEAYTVELEAELNQLKEENARLKAEEGRIQALRRQMTSESMEEKARANAEKTSQNLRRCTSCAW